MVQIILIGLASGGAAALLFASVASGSLFSILLFYLAPLPIMIAAIGWNQLAGLVGALLAAAALGVTLGGFFFLLFLIGVGLPAWWLGYLVLMARPGTAPDALEWYPIGRVVLWAAIIGALTVILAIPTFGLDAESFRGALRRAFERIIRIQSDTPVDTPLQIPGTSDPARLIDFLVFAIPPTAAVLSTITNLVNLWLAARIVKVSGRLRRPWPVLAEMTFPPLAPLLLAAALAGSFLPGLVGVVSGIFVASLLMAYAVLGFAVLHMTTRPIGGRSFVLAGTYAAVALFGWPVLLMSLLGLTDSIIDVRGRLRRRQRPPTGSS
jgi:hypothetical protein